MFDVCFAKPSGFQISMFEAVLAGEEEASKFYEHWITEVKQNVPAEKLLIHSAKEGWEPICDFLDLPVPDVSYPNIGDARQMKNEHKMHLATSYALFVGLPILIAVVAIILIIFYLS